MNSLTTSINSLAKSLVASVFTPHLAFIKTLVNEGKIAEETYKQIVENLKTLDISVKKKASPSSSPRKPKVHGSFNSELKAVLKEKDGAFKNPRVHGLFYRFLGRESDNISSVFAMYEKNGHTMECKVRAQERVAEVKDGELVFHEAKINAEIELFKRFVEKKTEGVLLHLCNDSFNFIIENRMPILVKKEKEKKKKEKKKEKKEKKEETKEKIVDEKEIDEIFAAIEEEEEVEQMEMEKEKEVEDDEKEMEKEEEEEEEDW